MRWVTLITPKGFSQSSKLVDESWFKCGYREKRENHQSSLQFDLYAEGNWSKANTPQYLKNKEDFPAQTWTPRSFTLKQKQRLCERRQITLGSGEKEAMNRTLVRSRWSWTRPAVFTCSLKQCSKYQRSREGLRHQSHPIGCSWKTGLLNIEDLSPVSSDQAQLFHCWY